MSWHQEKTYDSLMAYGGGSIKFVLLANGGAMLSLLTFIGQHIDKASNLKSSAILFVMGVIVGGVVNITAYLTQLSLFNEANDTIELSIGHRFWLWASIILIAVGVLFFALGSMLAVFSLTSVAGVEHATLAVEVKRLDSFDCDLLQLFQIKPTPLSF